METQGSPVKILFVCVGNACRSQMAEALARQLARDKAEIWSAGIWPYRSIIPETRDVLTERGIPTNGQWSKGLDEVPLASMDVVVQMGREVRFDLPEGFKGRLIEWEIPDPFCRDPGYFIEVLNLIEAQVTALLKQECS